VAPDAILGWAEELAVIDRVVNDERTGPRALLIEGQAGIGKTTLWREAVPLAEGSGLTLVSRPSVAHHAHRLIGIDRRRGGRTRSLVRP
jgi:hypothetical protein